jgi:hypothetical protein
LSIGRIISELPERRKEAEHILAEWCADLLRKTEAASSGRWAIVGGAVRDTLLQPFEMRGQMRMWWTWPDADLALTGSLDEHRIGSTRRTIRRNTFGGWKIEDPHLGVLDVWRVDFGELQLDNIAAWQAYLDQLDFSLNAVAFVWPERILIHHPNWVCDLQRRRICKLNPAALGRSLGAVRAIALAAKLEQTTGTKFRLSRRAAYDFYWLTHRAAPSEVATALDYLATKLKSSRWPQVVLMRLWAELARKPASPGFMNELSKRCCDQDGASPAKPRPRGKRGLTFSSSASLF